MIPFLVSVVHLSASFENSLFLRNLRPHQYTLQFFGFCGDVGNACIVTEYLPSGSLLNQLRILRHEKKISVLDEVTATRVRDITHLLVNLASICERLVFKR